MTTATFGKWNSLHQVLCTDIAYYEPLSVELACQWSEISNSRHKWPLYWTFPEFCWNHPVGNMSLLCPFRSIMKERGYRVLNRAVTSSFSTVVVVCILFATDPLRLPDPLRLSRNLAPDSLWDSTSSVEDQLPSILPATSVPSLSGISGRTPSTRPHPPSINSRFRFF